MLFLIFDKIARHGNWRAIFFGYGNVKMERFKCRLRVEELTKN